MIAPKELTLTVVSWSSPAGIHAVPLKAAHYLLNVQGRKRKALVWLGDESFSAGRAGFHEKHFVRASPSSPTHAKQGACWVMYAAAERYVRELLYLTAMTVMLAATPASALLTLSVTGSLPAFDALYVWWDRISTLAKPAARMAVT